MRSLLLGIAFALVVAGCSAAGDDEPSATTATEVPTTAVAEAPTTTEARPIPPKEPPLPVTGVKDPARAERIAELEAEVAALRQEIAWRDDLHALLTQMERIHPNPYWRIPEPDFHGRLAFLLSDLDEMTDDEITVDVARLMATIDGHSGLFTWTLGWDLAHMQFYRFAEGITVVRAEDPALVGARLVAIGGTPAGEVWEAAAELSPHDNPSTIELVTSIHLLIPRVLAVLGAIESPDELVYTLELEDGTTVDHVPTVSSREERAEVFGAGLAGLPQSDRMIYVERTDEPFWWTTLDDGTTYAQYNSVLTTNFGLEGLRAAVDDGNGKLVVDLRHNGGGNNNTYRLLLDYLSERFGNRCGLFLIIGRTTFSAATNFATEVEILTEAVYVGEPTGGSPNLYGDTRSVRLPNSGHIVRVSAAYWEFAGPDDRRVWIEPDIPIPPTATDFFSGRDAALEAAVAAPLCG